MKKDKGSLEQFELIGIKTEQFAAFECPDHSLAGVSFWTQISFDALGDDCVSAKAMVQFEQNETAILVCGVACNFQLGGLAPLENEMALSAELARNLASISFGTLRGLLHAHTSDMIHARLTLPVVDVVEMIPSKVVLKKP